MEEEARGEDKHGAQSTEVGVNKSLSRSRQYRQRVTRRGSGRKCSRKPPAQPLCGSLQGQCGWCTPVLGHSLGPAPAPTGSCHSAWPDRGPARWHRGTVPGDSKDRMDMSTERNHQCPRRSWDPAGRILQAPSDGMEPRLGASHPVRAGRPLGFPALPTETHDCSRS